MPNKIELLSPAGNFECLVAAVQAGCDAVYLSGKNFGARSYAGNFDNAELLKAVEYCHLHNVLVYVTVNTLVKENEFKELDVYLNYLNNINVDAVIVQDLGVIRFIKLNYPTLEVHASTQLNVFNKEGAALLKKLGVTRVVLARETSLDILKEINKEDIETEVFIHGALCFSSSGNCLMSSVIGGRSGNRGKCAQPCRKTYSLYEDNNLIVSKCNNYKCVDVIVEPYPGFPTDLQQPLSVNPELTTCPRHKKRLTGAEAILGIKTKDPLTGRKILRGGLALKFRAGNRHTPVQSRVSHTKKKRPDCCNSQTFLRFGLWAFVADSIPQPACAVKEWTLRSGHSVAHRKWKVKE